MGHSPEPWKFEWRHDEILDSESKRVLEDMGSLKPEDGDRIVACVNFCQNVPSDLLEELMSMRAGGDMLMRWLRSLLKVSAAAVNLFTPPCRSRFPGGVMLPESNEEWRRWEVLRKSLVEAGYDWEEQV
jgi:hypothetical protein